MLETKATTTQTLKVGNKLADISALNQHFNGHVHELVLALKTRHNASNPCCQLPVEILAHIFLEIAREPEYCYNPVMKTVPWMQVTHVCSYWRAVALECRALWCSISYAVFRNGSGLVEAMLDRSGALPLSVRYWGSEVMHDEATYSLFSLIKSDFHRLRSLEIIEKSYMSKLARDMQRDAWFANGAPALETLSLVNGSDQPRSFLHSRLLGPALLSLKHLELVGYTLPTWNILPLVSTLTSLVLECEPRLLAFSRPPPQGLWKALGRLRQLENLRLGHLIGDTYVGADDEVVTESIVFPKLEKLELADTVPCITNCIRRLRYPASASVTIEVCRAYRLSDITNLLGLLKAASCLKTNQCQEERVFIDLTITSTTKMDSSPTIQLKFDFQTGSPRGNLSLSLPSGHDDRFITTASVWSEFDSMYDLSQLRAVRLSGVGALSEEVWQSMFGQLRELRLIRFEETPTLQFLKWLVKDPALPTSVGDENPSRCSQTHLAPWLPRLSKFEFDTVILAPEEEIRAALTLLDFLEKRLVLRHRGCDVPLMQVSLRRCPWLAKGQYAAERSEIPEVRVSWVEDDESEGAEGEW
ncbi:hypothetical protein D9611_001323 [Ephemerocybe angulata]|uniref:F-box domain-containing protein n=1 Tax=Ephemerocybe angulata TaxID=980116 RepID=A0A8H5FMI7_9AGAR|nr:hypothetical protein D9611_001323 [Tulosesus angulatus]